MVSNDTHGHPHEMGTLPDFKPDFTEVSRGSFTKMIALTFSFLLRKFPRYVSMSVWLKAALATKTSQKERWIVLCAPVSHQKQLLKKNTAAATKSCWWPPIKNRLGKHFCLLIGVVAVVTELHHVIVNRCLLWSGVHGKVLIKSSASTICTAIGPQLVGG